jgi:hypothetical protein
MTELVKRLYETPLYYGIGEASALGEEAAAEIERLKAEVERLKKVVSAADSLRSAIRTHGLKRTGIYEAVMFFDASRAALTQEKKAAELGITLENPATALTPAQEKTDV